MHSGEKASGGSHLKKLQLVEKLEHEVVTAGESRTWEQEHGIKIPTVHKPVGNTLSSRSYLSFVNVTKRIADSTTPDVEAAAWAAMLAPVSLNVESYTQLMEANLMDFATSDVASIVKIVPCANVLSTLSSVGKLPRAAKDASGARVPDGSPAHTGGDETGGDDFGGALGGAEGLLARAAGSPTGPGDLVAAALEAMPVGEDAAARDAAALDAIANEIPAGGAAGATASAGLQTNVGGGPASGSASAKKRLDRSPASAAIAPPATRPRDGKLDGKAKEFVIGAMGSIRNGIGNGISSFSFGRSTSSATTSATSAAALLPPSILDATDANAAVDTEE